MASECKCIICGKPVSENGFIGTIKDISVSFCEEHAKDCKTSCDVCVHAETCPAGQKS